MDSKIKILDLASVEAISDNHNIIIESPEENETQRASFREVYQYIINKGLLTNIQSTQKGIEIKIENGVVTIKWFPPNWIEKTQYNKDDLILHNNILYKCIISHVSAEEFNQSYFQAIGVDIQAATAETLGLVQPDGETIMVDENGVIRTSTRSGIFWHVSATEPVENLSATDYWLNTETGEIKQYDGSSWGESLGIMKGPKGEDGKQGLSGPKGEQGEKGDKGDPGERGERGPQGIQGIPGIQGETGPQGTPFTYDMFTEEQLLNLTGPKGEIGPKGEQGETGPTGPAGAPFTYDMFTEEQLLNLTGPRGYSAYEIAVNNGYEDTEEKWLESLKGETIDNITQDGRTINVYTTNSNTPLSFTVLGGLGEWINDAKTAERFNDYTSTIHFTPGEFSHMEGYQTKVTGKFGHAEGNSTEVPGEAGHAENTLSVAGGRNSHAGGYEGRAIGENSFTHGEYTQAINKNSASFGKQTTTSREDQFVVGAFNEDDETALFIVGGGTAANKKNALVVDEEGNLKVKGQINPTNGYINLPYKGENGIQIIDNEDNSKTISLFLGEGLELNEDGSVKAVGGGGGGTIYSPGEGINITDDTISLKPATAETLGGIKKGNGINIAEDGTASVDAVNIENAVIIQQDDAAYLLHKYTLIDYIAGNKIGYAGTNNSIIVSENVAVKSAVDVKAETSKYVFGTVSTTSNTSAVINDYDIEMTIVSINPTYATVKLSSSKTGITIPTSTVNTHDLSKSGLRLIWEMIYPPGTLEKFPNGHVRCSVQIVYTDASGVAKTSNSVTLYAGFSSEAEYNAAVGLTYEPNTLTNVEEVITEV